MSEFKSPNFRNEDGSAAPDIVGVTTFTSPYYFVPPSGTTAERPSGDGLAPGMLRFNTDIGRLEVWRNDHWATILGESPNLGISTNPAGTSGGLGARGLFGGGYISSGPTISVNTIEYITISTLGDAIDFGDLISPQRYMSACASSTRAVFAGGHPGSSNIEYFNISSTGQPSTDFGANLSFSQNRGSAAANSTRGLFHSGFSPSGIDEVTIASTGTRSSFGNSGSNTKIDASTIASSTRAIFAGSYTPNATIAKAIDYVTFSTTGNSITFGEFGQLTVAQQSSASNSIRGVFAGGYSGDRRAVLQFSTIATLGNTQDFGDLSNGRRRSASVSSPTRMVIMGGAGNPGTNYTSPGEYITITSTGNAQDFGDLTTPTSGITGCSNAHGGL